MQARPLALLLAILLSLLAAPAHAIVLVHHDLTSLALEAEAIVLAHRSGERHLAPGIDLVQHRVEEVYAGSLRPGDVVEVSYDAIALQPMLGWPSTDAGPPVVSNEVILFLAPAGTSSDVLPDAGAPPPLRLIDSGLRIFAGGLAYRFEQHQNPGPYEPVPQRGDPFDVMGDPRAGAQLDRPALVRAIRAAVARAQEVRAALAANASPEGRRALVDAIGPPDDLDDAPVAASNFSFWEDTVAQSALAALASAGDLDALLDGVARVRGGVSYFRLRHRVPAPRLLEAAASQAAPLRRRLAALTLLEGNGLDLRGDRSAAQLAALYDDPEPAVRAGAVAVRTRDNPPPARLVEALVARWSRETDARVKLALLGAAEQLHVTDRLPAANKTDGPIVWAERRRRVVDVVWRNPGELRHHLVHLVITARAAGRTVATLDLAGGPLLLSGWSSEHTAGAHAFLGFDPPLAAGRYELTARVDLQDDRKQIVSHTFALGTLRTSLVAAPAPDDAASSLATSAPPPAPLPRSCMCSLPGDGRAESARGALAALLCAVLAATLRRRPT